MIFAIVRIYPLMGREQSTLDILESIKGPVAASTDCLGCSIAIETGEGSTLSYLEQWSSLAALERHIRTPLYGRLLEAVECSRLPPEIKFYEATGIGGLDLIEKIRLSH